jgi:release factor glutamine methyltransferase
MANSVTALLNQAYQQLAAVSDSALLDAEVLLCHCLHKNRSFIRAWPEHQLTDQQAAEFLALIAQRQQGVPVAYLTGEREFWSRSFKVNPDVLIPRPDSELLIELSLDLLPANQASKIIDLGTGSGILAITLAAERPGSQVIACDLSPAALRTAQDNAQQLQIDNVRFLASNWFSTITDRDFDLVISNPPYIDQHDPHLQQGDVRFEPDSALISAENGLQDIRLLADQARQHLKPGGYLLIEHGYDQQSAVQALFKRFNYQQITTHPDYAGNPRVTSGQWSPA